MPRGRVRAHPRRTAGGKVANVREHARKVKPGAGSKRKMWRGERGTIEGDTPIVPSVVAEEVVRQVHVYLQKKNLADDKLDDSVLTSFLEKHAEASYKADKQWAGYLRRSSGVATLMGFMRHWLAGELGRKHPEILRALPEGFKNGESIL
jgi:hypothetical protein